MKTDKYAEDETGMPISDLVRQSHFKIQMFEEWLLKEEKPIIFESNFQVFFQDKENLIIFLHLITSPKSVVLELPNEVYLFWKLLTQ
jgi:hypothetical protein